jgi:hypothetical protein
MDINKGVEMSALQSLENNLEDVFVKKAPALPENGKKAIIEWLPWINLVLGLLSLWAAYALWHWAHLANSLVNYANSLSAAYGGPAVAVNRLSATVWLSLAVLVVQALIYLAAFQALRDRKKSGWDLLFYALLVNVVYGVVVIFTDYGGFGSFVGSLVGSAVGFYFLFQIRSRYLGARVKAEKA